MKRVFIAVDIPAEIRSIASRHAAKLGKHNSDLRVSWVRPEAMHLTVRFLGNIDEGLLAGVNQSVAELARGIRPFELALAGAGVFPNCHRPKVIWLGLEDVRGVLGGLKAELDAILQSLGIESENRRFTPHLTLARLREPGKSRELALLHTGIELEPFSFEVKGITVYESRLGRGGATHQASSRAVFQ